MTLHATPTEALLMAAWGDDEQKPQKPQTPTGFRVTAESR